MTSSWVFDMANNASSFDYGTISDLNFKSLARSSGLTSARSGIVNVASSLKDLGVLTDEQVELLNKINGVAMVTVGVMYLASVYQAAIASQTAIESAMVSAEMAANILAQNWGGIAIATASAAIMAAAITEAAGVWNFPAVDLSNPIERGRAARQVSGVVNNG